MSGTATQQAVNPADSLSSYFSNLSKTSTSDHTWRASAARCFSTHVTVSPGQRILHLACGTGNLTFILADRVGPTGRVIGLDFTPSKLDRAITTKKHDLQKYANVDFHLVDDLLQLPTVPGLQGQEQTFDMLTMGYTLLLFPDPAAAILYWKRYLKPGGILAVDSTDARNLLAGLALEQTCKILELPMPRHKLWSMKKHTLRRTLEDCDFRVEKVVTIGDEAEWGKRYYEVAEWDDDFAEKVILGDVDLRRTLEYRSSRQRAQDVSKKEYRSSQKIAQDVFKEEWEKLATKDRFVEVNAVFLCIARKRDPAIRMTLEELEEIFDSETANELIGQYVETNRRALTRPARQLAGPDAGEATEVIFSGGCRCGSIRYTSSAAPTSVTFCYCRACQQLSGSSYLPFADVRTDAIKLSPSSSLTKLNLSDAAERTFCSSCGSPISMVYNDSKETTGLVMGTIDPDEWKDDWPRVCKHIFLKEKAPWTTVPEDGAPRYEGFSNGG